MNAVYVVVMICSAVIAMLAVIFRSVITMTKEFTVLQVTLRFIGDEVKELKESINALRN